MNIVTLCLRILSCTFLTSHWLSIQGDGGFNALQLWQLKPQESGWKHVTLIVNVLCFSKSTCVIVHWGFQLCSITPQCVYIMIELSQMMKCEVYNMCLFWMCLFLHSIWVIFLNVWAKSKNLTYTIMIILLATLMWLVFLFPFFMKVYIIFNCWSSPLFFFLYLEAFLQCLVADVSFSQLLCPTPNTIQCHVYIIAYLCGF